MGIDGIGKKGPPAPPAGGEVGGPGRAKETGRAFDVGRGERAAQPGATTGAHAALERLRAGEIDVKGYVDIKVDEATAHLSALPPAELQAIRSALRERMASDPTLVDLVRTATGSVPQPPSDE